MIADLEVLNTRIERLSHLTVLMTIRGDDGAERVSQRVTLDLARLEPRIPGRLVAELPGWALAEDDTVEITIETGLPDDVLRQLPEYRALVAAAP